MGDRDFEDFLNQRENGGDDDESDLPISHKQLLLSALELKLSSITTQIDIFLKCKKPSLKYQKYINKLMKKSGEGFIQMEYLIAIILDGMSKEEKSPGELGGNI